MVRNREQALERFERAVELPLLVLAVAMVPLLVLPLLLDLPAAAEDAFVAADWFIWAVFAVEYVVRLSLAPRRWHFVRQEWPDLVIVVLPFLRPLRVVRSARALRLLRLARLVAFLSEAGQGARRLLVLHRLHYALLATVVIVLGSAAVTFALEDGGGGTIDSFGDALWWAVTTVTAFLMMSGIALFGVLTANLASFMLERGPGESGSDGDVAAKLDEVLRRLAQLEERQKR